MNLEKEVKYPIKYAIIPIKDQRDYEVIANIVSKSFVISERKTFLSDGSGKTLYEVVFPYKKENSKISIPEFVCSKCINSVCVEALFDTFESALVVANELNENILYREIGCLPFDKNFEKNVENLKKQHQKIIDKYKNLENYINQETSDMKVTQTYNSTLEDIIKKIIASDSEYALSAEEIEYLKQLIEDRSCNNTELYGRKRVLTRID